MADVREVIAISIGSVMLTRSFLSPTLVRGVIGAGNPYKKTANTVSDNCYFTNCAVKMV